MSNTLKGILSNAVAILLLYLISSPLNLRVYAVISLGIQYLIFFFHGLPYNSEKYYDLSGSLTHLSLILFSLLQHGQRN